MKKTIFLAVLFILSAPCSGQSLKRIDATGTTMATGGGGTLQTSPLSIVFDDANGDSLVETNEIEYLIRQGLRVDDEFGMFLDFYSYDAVVGTPDIPGISTSSGVDLDGNPCCWRFTGSQVAEPSGIDAWFPSRWENYNVSDIVIPDCDAPITMEEVIAGLEGGFDVDPSVANTLTPIWNASNGTSSRGFIDHEQPQLYPVQCDEDHFALYLWFAAGDPDTEDAIQVVSDFRDTVELTLTIDGSPVALADFTPYIGVRPDTTLGRGILKVAGIISPGDLATGPHVAEMALSQDGFDLGTNRVGFYVVASNPPRLFDDAPPGSFAFSFIEALASAGITSGCGNNNYCPNDPVTRAQMAVFLERGINGSSFAPRAASGTIFLDVSAGAFAASFIEQLYLDGITAGCGNFNYCPNDLVTRAQMAVFLLRAKYGSVYLPPPATGLFTDAPPGSFAADWIEQLAAEGITSGCGNGNYCPGDPVTRAQMAVFLVRAFDLPVVPQ